MVDRQAYYARFDNLPKYLRDWINNCPHHLTNETVMQGTNAVIKAKRAYDQGRIKFVQATDNK